MTASAGPEREQPPFRLSLRRTIPSTRVLSLPSITGLLPVCVCERCDDSAARNLLYLSDTPKLHLFREKGLAFFLYTRRRLRVIKIASLHLGLAWHFDRTYSIRRRSADDDKDGGGGGVGRWWGL